jgi:hypothetical protein
MSSDETLVDPGDLQPPVEPTRSPVTFNAVKHGILSVSPVIPIFENEEDWEDFRNSIFEELSPKGGLQQALADRVATLLWRLMRVVRYEREAVTGSIMEVGQDIRLADDYLGEAPRSMTLDLKERMDKLAMRRLLPEDQAINKILRYEGRLHRHLLQTIHQIKLLKSERSLPTGSSLGQPNVDAPATRLFGKESGAAGYNGGTPHI